MFVIHAVSLMLHKLSNDEFYNLFSSGEQLWSTQAYIINKAAVRPYIDSVVSLDALDLLHVAVKMPPSVMGRGGVNSSIRFPYRIVADIYLYIALGE